MPLTDIAVRSAKPDAKPYRLHDAGGLYVEVAPSGGKWWRLKYRFDRKEKRLSLGTYPAVSLKDARSKRDATKKLLAEGIDPSANRRAEQTASSNTFEAVAREWFLRHEPTWAPTHSAKVIRRLELNVFPWVGGRPIAQLSAPDLLQVIRRIEERGAVDTAHRVLQYCGQVFRYAVATGRATRDLATDLRGAIPPAQREHHASLTDPLAVGQLLGTIHTYKGSMITKCALQLAPLVFVRPGELRRAEWTEINLDAAEWRIPANKMKSGAPLIVPLSTQAIAVFEELKPVTGKGRYVFPGRRSDKTPMSENTVNAALRNLGYAGDQMTGHGFRSIASTILNEQGWNRDAIERQLAHGERDKVRAAYNHALHLPERKRMMQKWADYLDHLCTQAQRQSGD